MAIRCAKRKRREPTPSTLVHEQLGVALGRLCVADATIRRAIMDGFTRAIREHTSGAAPAVELASRELAAAREAMASLHGVARPKRRGRR